MILFPCLSYLLERQVVGEGALHVVVLTGRVHVVGAYLQDTVQRFDALFNSTLHILISHCNFNNRQLIKKIINENVG